MRKVVSFLLISLAFGLVYIAVLSWAYLVVVCCAAVLAGVATWYGYSLQATETCLASEREASDVKSKVILAQSRRILELSEEASRLTYSLAEAKRKEALLVLEKDFQETRADIKERRLREVEARAQPEGWEATEIRKMQGSKEVRVKTRPFSCWTLTSSDVRIGYPSMFVQDNIRSKEEAVKQAEEILHAGA